MVEADLPIYDQTDYGIKLIEEERRRIARDLHDGPAQALTNISMRLDVIRRLLTTDPEMAMQEMTRTNSRVVAAVNDIRRLIYDLRPIAIDEVGLISATTELCRRFEKDWHIAVTVQSAEDVKPDFAPAKQVALYRLLQELLNNVKKHAEAKQVRVAFARDGVKIQITVEDDGKGFDPTSIPAGHFGIAGMRERVDYLNGTLDIQSELGHGSLFVISVPVYKDEDQ